MNIEGKRFLALNAVIHGHGFMPAFDGDYELAMKAFGYKNTTAVKKLEWRLNATYEKYKDCTIATMEGLPVQVLLRFYHTHEYSFVVIPGQPPFFLDAIIGMAQSGNIDSETALAVFSHAITDVQFIANESETHIADGILYLKKCTQEELSGYVNTAFSLMFTGPKPTEQAAAEAAVEIYNRKEYFNLATIRTISAAAFRALITAFANLNFNPTVYAETLFHTPDYMYVYEHTGCILSKDPTDPQRFLWMVDVTNTSRVSVRTVTIPDVQSLLVSSLRDLQSVCCEGERLPLIVKGSVG